MRGFADAAHVFARSAGGAPVGVEFGVLGGSVVFLPAPRSRGGDAGRAQATAIVAAVEERLGRPAGDRPLWVSREPVPGLDEREAEAERLAARVRQAEEQRDAAEAEAEPLRRVRDVLWTEGSHALLPAARRCLELLGFAVRDIDDAPVLASRRRAHRAGSRRPGGDGRDGRALPAARPPRRPHRGRGVRAARPHRRQRRAHAGPRPPRAAPRRIAPRRGRGPPPTPCSPPPTSSARPAPPSPAPTTPPSPRCASASRRRTGWWTCPTCWGRARSSPWTPLHRPPLPSRERAGGEGGRAQRGTRRAPRHRGV